MSPSDEVVPFESTRESTSEVDAAAPTGTGTRPFSHHRRCICQEPILPLSFPFSSDDAAKAAPEKSHAFEAEDAVEQFSKVEK